jgi:hypothetical protein
LVELVVVGFHVSSSEHVELVAARKRSAALEAEA